MADYFTEEALAKSPPLKRAAYSDRTAWILAEISRLVYESLPCQLTVKALVEEIKNSVDRGEFDDEADALVRKAFNHGGSEGGPIEEALRHANFELLDSFAVLGTEGLVAKLNPCDNFEGMLVVAFRGTEKSVEDLKSDVRANLVSALGGGRVHRGFSEAFDHVHGFLRELFNENKGLPVYMTGHSLGGALALVATRYLESDSTGATYTFGCPRVADDQFFDSVKTPVYRVVNSADFVPRLPFGYGIAISLSVIRLLPFNGTYWISEWIRRNFFGYTHYGNLVFLHSPSTAPDDDNIHFKGLVVKKSPNVFWRTQVFLLRLLKTRGKAGINDHRIQEYCQKLLAYAQRRNRQ